VFCVPRLNCSRLLVVLSVETVPSPMTTVLPVPTGNLVLSVETVSPPMITVLPVPAGNPSNVGSVLFQKVGGKFAKKEG
jgi:hypothetical protein